MNEQALMEILLQHLQVTETMLEDYLRFLQTHPDFLPKPELANMLSTIRLQRQRVRAIVNP